MDLYGINDITMGSKKKKREEMMTEIVTWEDVRKNVARVNPELVGIIDQISPGERFKLVKARYCYGDLIVHNGRTFLPTSMGLQHLESNQLEPALQQHLGYSPIPLFLTLNQTNEVFVDTGVRSIPLNLFYPGSLLGLFETMNYQFDMSIKANWSVSAGARTLFILPKVSENSGLNRLRIRFGLSASDSLRNFSDHWNIIRQITNHSDFEQPWRNDVVFFTKDWLISRYNDENWNRFRSYLYMQCWRQAQFALSKIEQSMYWESYADAINSRNLKPSPYIADQIKHILGIGAGQWPGFVPADDSQMIGPTGGIQRAIVEVYQLRNYLPTIMHTRPLDKNSEDSVYYSLYYPTLLEGSPNNKSATTIMLALREIRLLISTLKERAMIWNHLDKNRNVVNQVNFDYFHVESDVYQEILSSQCIVENDPRFLGDQSRYPDRSLCTTSSFWRGCIQITQKKTSSEKTVSEK